MSQETREYLLNRLTEDLLGPAKPNECIYDRPSDRYLTGILSPQRLPVEQEQDEKLELESSDEGDEGATTGDSVPIVSATRPASAGISFAASTLNNEIPQICVRISCGTYSPVEEADSASDKTLISWRRSDHYIELQEIQLTNGVQKKDITEGGILGLQLYIQVTPWKDMLLVTVASININEVSDSDRRREIEEKTFFQVMLEIIAEEGTSLPARPIRKSATDEDGRVAELIYRNAREFAVGHTCSAEWDAPAKTYADAIRTTWIPNKLVRATSSVGDKVFDFLLSSTADSPLSAFWLSENEGDTLCNGLKKVTSAYGDWITEQEKRIPTVKQELRVQAKKHMDTCKTGLKRMEEAIDLIVSNKDIESAFRLANRAMLIQRQWSYPDDTDLIWRPFQIGFLLLSMSSVAVKEHPDRDTMDLLWFPTGGGKTEAYLALTAFTLFLRRIRNQGNPGGNGVSVFMRYTLRLLTIQQFQRAASLIFACEYLRHGNWKHSVADISLGAIPFSIGLWVGSGSVPNNFDDARDALLDITAPSTPAQLTYCPCCHEKLNWCADEKTRTVSTSCTNNQCELAIDQPVLPVWTVDDDIYREAPSLVIGTVDKFAQIVRKPDTCVLFGLNTPHDGPDLIIQDELHLISGPLGTMAACYEIAIDELCSREGIRPKIIGSTATIRRASEQIRALFNRDTYQFPAPGIDADNSGFAVRDNNAPGRIYAGITTAGRSAKFTLQAACATLLQSCESSFLSDRERDPYWTLVAYFNSLRELGGALVLMQDDVFASIEEYAERRQEKPRVLIPPVELTSRVASSKIPELLTELEEPVSSGNAHDILLASNMISVGVDIPRLGLMVVNGQPKGIAEYIQSTSRVGRGTVPGLVLTLYNNGKTRDRSHFETFSTWHSTLYREVEATSVTPFASRARDRALHAVLVALVRHLLPTLRTSPRLNDVKETEIRRLFKVIIDRTEDIDSIEVEGVKRFLDDLLGIWRSRGNLRQYWSDKWSGTSLLISAEEAAARRAAGRAEGIAWPTPNSLRSVEPGTAFFLVGRLKPPEDTNNATE